MTPNGSSGAAGRKDGEGKRFPRHHVYTGNLVASALILIPLGTHLFGLKRSPFHFTLSMIGNTVGNRLRFVLWGIVTAALLGFSIISLFRAARYHGERGLRLLRLSVLLLVVTVLTPLLEGMPVLGAMHNFFGAAFGISLVACLSLFIRYLAHVQKKISLRSRSLLHFTVAGSLSMLFLFGITGVFELFFFSSVTLLLLVLDSWFFFRDRRRNQWNCGMPAFLFSSFSCGRPEETA